MRPKIGTIPRPEHWAVHRRSRREPANSARRLTAAVADVEDPTAEVLTKERRQLVPPLGREAVLDERLVFRANLAPLLFVSSETKAAGSSKGVPDRELERGELGLRPPPERAGRIHPIRPAADVVTCRPAPH